MYAYFRLSVTSMKTSLPCILLPFYYAFNFVVFAFRCGMCVYVLWLAVNVVKNERKREPERVCVGTFAFINVAADVCIPEIMYYTARRFTTYTSRICRGVTQITLRVYV